MSRAPCTTACLLKYIFDIYILVILDLSVIKPDSRAWGSELNALDVEERHVTTLAKMELPQTLLFDGNY